VGVPTRHFFNGEDISREMELGYARRLLLDFGKGCPYHGIYMKKIVQMFNLRCKCYP